MHYNKMSGLLTKEEIAVKMKKLKATKKAASELQSEEEIFYGLALALNMTKEQKKRMAESQAEMDKIYRDYQA